MAPEQWPKGWRGTEGCETLWGHPGAPRTSCTGMKWRKGVRATTLVEDTRLWGGGGGAVSRWQCYTVTQSVDLGVKLFHGLESGSGLILAVGHWESDLLESHLKELV